MFPSSVKELSALGWDYIDVILFCGDAFIDHPSFGAAVIARILQREGWRVAVVPQPNWRDDLRDFRKLGRPRLFFAVTSGAMDSMDNHYTANKRLRSDDAYTPEGRAGYRPDYAVRTYSGIIKKLYPDVPLVIGGIEASLRRFTHYDYWSDSLFPSILTESRADVLIYGMGERPVAETARRISMGLPLDDIPQTAVLVSENRATDAILLHSYEECLRSKRSFAENFDVIEREANRMSPSTLVEPSGEFFVKVNPPYPPATEEEMDSFWNLPYTRMPHPRYKGKRIPAFDMIKNSINIHRGCFGGCSFCTIAAHQGRFIQNRSEESILKEVEILVMHPEFHGVISDVGAPTANMYGMHGRDLSKCAKCVRKSCLSPKRCPNLLHSHSRLLDLYARIDNVKGVRHCFIGSGIRYDLFLDENGWLDETSYPYFRELVVKHTSGRLKVAPEHTENHVLQLMNKPPFALFVRLKDEFMELIRKEKLKYQIVPYFISSHPGCTLKDMQNLSRNRALEDISLEQVQDFTPTPMTASSVMFYTGINPIGGGDLFVERHQEAKKRQKSCFFLRKSKK
ncbi:MAG: YgiQ family radical SAM protein [Alistipes sp.]|nr:YgiQ family radical SAM protein [Candidatus Minthomonas equi]